jgi:hypothetical protein
MTPTRPDVWAYTYRLKCPPPAEHLQELERILAEEHAAAKSRAGTWSAQLVSTEQVSHILIVADSPQLDSEVNRRIEAVLQRLGTGFDTTLPLIVPPDDR